MKKITDGTSKTMLVGEAVTDVQAILASTNQSTGYPRPEPTLGNRKDHWYIGSDGIDGPGTGDTSEALGSTGVPPNLHKLRATHHCNGGIRENFCQELQLSFSSEHPGIVQAVMCDGSVQQIEEGIAADVWSKMGTRRVSLISIRGWRLEAGGRRLEAGGWR